MVVFEHLYYCYCIIAGDALISVNRDYLKMCKCMCRSYVVERAYLKPLSVSSGDNIQTLWAYWGGSRALKLYVFL